MPYAGNQGVQIHYEVVGKGDPLLLVHGMFANWKTWRDYGFVDAMKDEYRLIMVDVRGHGGSDKPHDPELYEEKLLVTDLAAVLDDLDVAKAHYLGYSMGGWIAFILSYWEDGIPILICPVTIRTLSQPCESMATKVLSRGWGQQHRYQAKRRPICWPLMLRQSSRWYRMGGLISGTSCPPCRCPVCFIVAMPTSVMRVPWHVLKRCLM